jgi:Rrf2 family protein
MKISTRSRYGLRLLMELAAHPGSKPEFLNEIAQNQDISEKYLSKLVIPLRGAGLIQSERGAHGGYALAKPADSITLAQIVDALEGGLSMVDCACNPGSCDRSPACAARGVWAGMEKAMRDYCDSLTLGDIVRSGKAANFAEFI